MKERVASKRMYLLALTVKLAKLEKGYYAMKASRAKLVGDDVRAIDLYKRINKRLRLMEKVATEMEAALKDPRQYVRYN